MATLTPDITVNGRVIPAAAIAAEAQNHPAPRGKPGHAWQAAARALAMRELLLQKARAIGLHPDPREIAPGQVETDDEALIRQLLETTLTPAPVDPAALRATYDAAPERFRAPPLWEAAHILIPADPANPAARTGALAIARQIIAQLQAQPARFAALAAEHSACSSRDSGGFLGQLGPGDTVAEFESALRDLPEGGITAEPVQTRFGLHVIRLDARAEGAILPFEVVEPRLRAAAEKAAWVRAARALGVSLASRATVTGISLGAA